MDLRPLVTSNPHPLIGDGRVYVFDAPRYGETLGEYVSRVKVELPKGELIVIINGILAQHQWQNYIIQTGDDIIFRSAVHGGGGGGKVLRLVAMVALAAVSMGVGAWAAGTMGFASGTSAFNMAAGLSSGLFMMAGSALINAVLPPPKPANMGLKDKEQSPTYGINAGRNQASLYGPMPLVFGRHKIVPFLASKPYTTFVGDDQYLSQAFHFGLQTDLDLEVIRIGQTPLSNYKEVEVNRSEHDGKLSLVAGNVDVLDGFELSSRDGWIERTTPLDTEFISIDVASTLFDIADDGDEQTIATELQVQYRQVGDSNWLPMGGHGEVTATHYWSLGKWEDHSGFVEQGDTEVWHTNHVWQQIKFGGVAANEHNAGQVENVCHTERRLNNRTLRMEDVQVCELYRWEYRPHPVTQRRPWQGTAPDPFKNLVGSGFTRLEGSNPRKPTRITIDQALARGQYELRIKKTAADQESSRKSNKTTVAQVRCTQVDDADYTGQLRMAVRIKATAQLNGVIDELNGVVSAKCPVWTGSAWEVKPTSNPAWWFLFWARGKRDLHGRRMYGECLPDSRIDVDGIKAWAQFCDGKQLRFDFVLDRKMSIEEVYYTIARAGRASTTWQTGKRGVVWDNANKPITTLLTPANIIAGSLSYNVINAEVADEVVVNFYNAQNDWQKDVVRQKVPNVTVTNNPITLDLEGCTSVRQAGREANLIAASQLYHRKQYSFEMDIEGAVLARGDVARLTHDLTSYSAGGRLISVVGNVITLDSDVGQATNAWLTLRSPTNKLFNTRVNANANRLTLTNGWTFGDVENAQNWLWQYDPVKLAGTNLQIKSVIPQSNGNVKFEALEYIDAYYACEDNIFQHAPPRSDLLNPVVVKVYDASLKERVVSEGAKEVEAALSWVMSENVRCSVAVYVNAQLLKVFDTQGALVTFVARENDVVDVEITPIAAGKTCERFKKQFIINGTAIPVPAPTGLEVIGGFTKSTVRIKWDRVGIATGYEVQVVSAGVVRRSVAVGNTLTYTYSYSDMVQDGGVVRSLTFKVRALGLRESKSIWAEVSGTNPQIGALQGIQVNSGVKTLIIQCDKPSEEDFAGYLFWLSDNANFQPTESNAYLDSNNNLVYFDLYNNQPLETKDYYLWCAGYDTFGKDNLTLSGSFLARPLIIQLDPQSITNEMIKDGAFTENKFASDIKPPKIVTVLPPVGTSQEGDKVVLTTNKKMYVFLDGQWRTAEIGEDDLPLIPSTKLTGQVQAGQIASNSIGTGHMQANSVTTGVLAVGAVGADQLKANSITAAKMVLTDTTNIFSDPYFEYSSDPTFWVKIGADGGVYHPYYSGFSGAVYYLSSPHGVTENSGWEGIKAREQKIRVMGDRDYYFAYKFRIYNAGTSVSRSVVYWYDERLNLISSSSQEFTSTTQMPTRCEWATKSPPNAKYAGIYFQSNGQRSTSGFIIGDFEVRQMNNASLIVDGSILARNIAAGTITGDKVAANTITGDRLLANSVTSREMRTGSITASSGIIANGAITNAMIGNAAITTAKIGDLQVDTIKIKDNAVTTGLSLTVDSGNVSVITIKSNTPSMPLTANKLDIAYWYPIASYQFPSSIGSRGIMRIKYKFWKVSGHDDPTLSFALFINNNYLGGLVEKQTLSGSQIGATVESIAIPIDYYDVISSGVLKIGSRFINESSAVIRSQATIDLITFKK